MEEVTALRLRVALGRASGITGRVAKKSLSKNSIRNKPIRRHRNGPCQALGSTMPSGALAAACTALNVAFFFGHETFAHGTALNVAFFWT